MAALLTRNVGLRVATLGFLFLAFSVPLQAQEFAEPFRVFANGEAIDTDAGHAAPLVTDFDGDGLNDLLVGQFGDGILKIYRNTGSNNQPKYAAGVEFMDDTDGDGRIPTG